MLSLLLQQLNVSVQLTAYNKKKNNMSNNCGTQAITNHQEASIDRVRDGPTYHPTQEPQGNMIPD